MNSKQPNQQNSVFPTHRRKLANPADQKWPVVGKCPDCGEDVLSRPQAYDCSLFPYHCNFKLRKGALARWGKETITAEEMMLLLKRRTIPFLGLIDQFGDRFDCGGLLVGNEKCGYEIHLLPIAKIDRPYYQQYFGRL